jgi:hypothetical protein
VTFARIDTPATPNRFVTRIVVDRNDPERRADLVLRLHAITPSTPATSSARPTARHRHATFEVLDADLGDLPINTIAFDDARGDLYAGTDFGRCCYGAARRPGNWPASASRKR